jgi:hypothetical protein
MFKIGDKVTIKDWIGQGKIENHESHQWDWENPGPAFGVRMDCGCMVWIPENRANELLKKVEAK